jgi:phosphoglycolate phosphatase
MQVNRRRLYLFDIDGTLIVSGGAGGSAMCDAFVALWRREDDFRNIEFSGRTDLAIFRQICRACDIDPEASPQDLRRFKRAYRRRLPARLRACDGRVLPGVVNLLEQLSADPDATLALGTGNFRTTAALKLNHYALAHYFQTGGFGDHTEDRAEMIAAGIRSAQRRAGAHGSVFVIGDTVHDVAAARANGCVAVGVATGTATEAALSAAGADLVLPTLESAADQLARRD